MGRTSEVTRLCDVEPLRGNVNVEVIVLECLGSTHVQGNRFYTFRVADASGSLDLTLWQESARDVCEGDILHIMNGKGKLYQRRLQLTVTEHSSVEKTGEFCLEFSDSVLTHKS